MFAPSQHDVRRFFCETCRKQRERPPAHAAGGHRRRLGRASTPNTTRARRAGRRARARSTRSRAAAPTRSCTCRCTCRSASRSRSTSRAASGRPSSCCRAPRLGARRAARGDGMPGRDDLGRRSAAGCRRTASATSSACGGARRAEAGPRTAPPPVPCAAAAAAQLGGLQAWQASVQTAVGGKRRGRRRPTARRRHARSPRPAGTTTPSHCAARRCSKRGSGRRHAWRCSTCAPSPASRSAGSTARRTMPAPWPGSPGPRAAPRCRRRPWRARPSCGCAAAS